MLHIDQYYANPIMPIFIYIHTLWRVHYLAYTAPLLPVALCSFANKNLQVLIGNTGLFTEVITSI